MELPGTEKDAPLKGLTEVLMTGGPPWGFSISGGSEFGMDLFVTKVAEDGIAKKVGGLKEGDRLVYINDVRCTSRSNAIETVKMGKNDLKIQLKRIQSMDSVTKAVPKRSNSFYGTVVENMLDSVSSDISSTHYSLRRNSIRGEKDSPRKYQQSETDVASGKFDKGEVAGKNGRQSPGKMDTLLLLGDENFQIRGSAPQVSPRGFQRVKVKSVKVTSMVPAVKDNISNQLKNKLDTSPDRKKEDRGSVRRIPMLAKDPARQTKSMDEERQSWSDPVIQRKVTTPPGAVVNCNAEQEPIPMNVAKARAMFEKISKSQEALDMIGVKASPRNSPNLEKKVGDSVKMKRVVDQPTIRQSGSISPEERVKQSNHVHTKSLPNENGDAPRRELRRPGNVPNRRSHHRTRPKSAHFPSEDQNSEAQNLPLGYGAVSSYNRLAHGRKSIATCAPSAINMDTTDKRESSFRHSIEDLRPNENREFARKSSTLPANQMREAAKKFHQELMKKDPKFRYSIGQIEQIARPHLSSSTGGSSSSSLSSSQDQLNVDSTRRLSNGPSLSSRACSTSSLDSSPGPQDPLTSPSEEDNTILSRLLREQRINSNGSLVRIEEEARSPRGKASVANETVETQATIATDENRGKRTISIQTDDIPEISKKDDMFSKRPGIAQTSPKFTAMVPTYSGVETCIDDVDPDLLEDELRKTKGDDDVHPPMEMTLHAKEPSNDSISELDAISKNMEQNLQDANDGDDFPLPDLDELPPPPDELLVASPPEREKPQRVINRKKRDQHSMYNASRNSSCVSTDSNVSTSTMDSGIGVRAYSISDSSPRNSPTRVTSEFDEDYSHCYDEGFKGSREELLDEDCQAYSPGSNEELEQKDYKNEEIQGESPANFGTPSNGSRSDSADTSPRIEELDQEKTSLIESMRKKIEELKLQEQEIAEEIKTNEGLGKRVQGLVERKATQTEFSKYELFIGELNKIVSLLLSLTQRLHRYEQMLQDLDMSEEEDKQKRETLIAKIEKLRSQHEDACHLREVNDKRGENVANFLDKYFNEEEFADFQYYVDMKSQLALMQSEIKEKVKLGEERYQALDSSGKF